LLDRIGDSEYKQKILKISSKIDRWHKKASKKNVGVFKDDEDFTELTQSPNKFD